MTIIQKYQKRISGPILDRIDIHLEVPRVPVQKLSTLDNGEPSRSIRQRVEAARDPTGALCPYQQAKRDGEW